MIFSFSGAMLQELAFIIPVSKTLLADFRKGAFWNEVLQLSKRPKIYLTSNEIYFATINTNRFLVQDPALV